MVIGQSQAYPLILPPDLQRDDYGLIGKRVQLETLHFKGKLLPLQKLFESKNVSRRTEELLVVEALLEVLKPNPGLDQAELSQVTRVGRAGLIL